jgi:hypothetical protein
MPGPGAYWFGKEEMEAVMEVMQSGYLFRYGSENDPKFLHKVYTLEKNLPSTVSKFCIGNIIGTSSLLASVVALGLTRGDGGIVPAPPHLLPVILQLFFLNSSGVGRN